MVSDMIIGMADPSEYVKFPHEQPRVWVLLDLDESRDGSSSDGIIVGTFAHLEEAWHAGEVWIESRYADRVPEQIKMTIQEWQGYECHNELKYGPAGWVRESWQNYAEPR